MGFLFWTLFVASFLDLEGSCLTNLHHSESNLEQLSLDLTILIACCAFESSPHCVPDSHGQVQVHT